MSYKDKLELEQIEENILSAEEEVERIQKLFSSPDFYEKYKDQLTEINDELNSAKQKVKQLYERWDELEKLKESLNN